jgi:hypothetical protein
MVLLVLVISFVARDILGHGDANDLSSLVVNVTQ